LKKKVILISGCSNGIGKDLSEYYQKNGFIVVGFGASVKIKSKKNLFYDIVNLNSKNQIKSFINLIIKKYKKIDYFINNAAAAPAAFPALLNNFEFTEKVFKTNVIGQIFLINEISKIMLKNKFGRIINISSMSVALNLEGTSLYSSSKAAVEKYLKILSKEISYKNNNNITLNTLRISMYNSKSFRELGKKTISKAKQNLAYKKVLNIYDILNVINPLLKEKNYTLSGQTLNLGLVNGD
jgi:3-oxoacyl-[acyl-carrier protein] reductase|tara:strand:- start:3205 stop:3924 length:720 start_codon:yes stop_codon:yes gene_type:complete